MGTQLSEAHTGYRAYSRRLLLTVPFLRNSADFSFDSELLMQAAHFGMRITGGARPRALLRGRVVGGPAQRHRLRPEDAVDRRSAAAAPRADRARRRKFKPPTAKIDAKLSPAVTGERVVTAAGRLQPHLAAPRGRLRAVRAATWRRAGSPTSAAGSATATGCWRRGRPSAWTSTPRCSRARSGRPWPPTCAGCRSPTASFDGAIAVHSIEHVPDPERALCRDRAGAQGRAARRCS